MLLSTILQRQSQEKFCQGLPSEEEKTDILFFFYE